MDQKTPITPGEWTKKHLNIRTLALPSGDTVLVKDVDLESMLMQGYIPTSLLNSLISSGLKIQANKATKEAELEGVKEQELKKIDDLSRRFALIAVIEPKLKSEGLSDEEAVNVYELTFTDCLFIFSSCVRGGASKYSPFLRKEPLRDNDRQDVPEVQSETVGDPGNSKPSGKT